MNTNDAFSLTNGWGKTNMHLAPTGSSLTNEPAGHLSLTNEVLIDAAQFRAKWGTSNVTVTLALRVSGNDMAEVKQLNFTLSQPLVSEAEWVKAHPAKQGLNWIDWSVALALIVVAVSALIRFIGRPRQ